MRRREGRRPIVRAVAATAIVALAVVLGYVVAGHDDGTGNEGTWKAWKDPLTGVEGLYPSSWHRQTFDEVGLATHRGTVFSNVPHQFEHPDLPEGSSTTAWDLADLPGDAVVVEVAQTVRFSLPCKPTTRFPLSLSDAELVRDKPDYGAPPRLWIPACVEGNDGFGIHVHMFPDASTSDRAAVRTFVESIRPVSKP
jgi:hypothetical protein